MIFFVNAQLINCNCDLIFSHNSDISLVYSLMNSVMCWFRLIIDSSAFVGFGDSRTVKTSFAWMLFFTLSSNEQTGLNFDWRISPKWEKSKLYLLNKMEWIPSIHYTVNGGIITCVIFSWETLNCNKNMKSIAFNL